MKLQWQSRYENLVNLVIFFFLSLSLCAPRHWFETFSALLFLLVPLLSLGKSWKIQWGFFLLSLSLLLSILLAQLLNFVSLRILERALDPSYIFLFAPFIYNRIFNQKSYKVMILGCCFGVLGAMAIVFFQMKYNYGIIVGNTNKVEFADLAVFLGVMAVTMSSYHNFPKNKVFIWCCFFIALLTAVLDGSRGSWAAILPFIFFYWGYTKTTNTFIIKSKLVIIIIIAVIFTLLLLVTKQYEQFYKIIIDVNNYKHHSVAITANSIGARFEMWRASWDLFKSSPIVGIGDWSTGVASLKTQVDQAILTYNQPHNEYLRFLATTGVIGFLLFLTIMILPFWTFRQMSNNLKFIIYTLQSVFMVFAITQGIFCHHNGVVIYGLFLAWCFYLKENENFCKAKV